MCFMAPVSCVLNSGRWENEAVMEEDLEGSPGGRDHSRLCGLDLGTHWLPFWVCSGNTINSVE